MENEVYKSPIILLLNNAYPTLKEPKRGGYIKSIENCLVAANLEVDRLVILGSKKTIITYFKFYVKLFFYNYKKYNYIYIHHYPHLFLPLIFRFKGMENIIINFHGGDIIFTSKFQWLINKVSYLFIPKNAKFIVPSLYFKEQVIRAIPSLHNRVFYISPSGGVDMTVFKPLKIEKEEITKINIGFASGIDTNKGIDDLIVLLNHLNPSKFNFHIIDYGKNRDAYISKLETFNNAHFYELFEKNKMPEFYSKIDVLFFPSKSESLGLVALEAMSCGVPVIGPNDFALSAIIENRVSGEKYESSIDKDFINALNRFIKNKDDYKTRVFIESQYSRKFVVKQFKTIFNN